jgi:hypothetical protein
MINNQEVKKSSLLTNIIAVFFVLAAILLSIYYWRPSLKSKAKNQNLSETEVNQQTKEEKQNNQSNPEEIIQDFSKNIFAVLANPENQQALDRAYFLISDSAKNSLSNFESSSSALANFCGVNAPPGNQEIVVKSVSQFEDKATVEALWQYPFGPVSKYFNLVLVDGIWKIDFISK